MRILVATGLNQGTAEYQNIGDIAMLQVAVARLAELWPDAEILVLTDSEAGLARFCPQAKPLSRCGAETWLVDGVITGPLHLVLPDWITVHIRRTKRWLRMHAPGMIDFLLGNRFRLHDGEARGPKVRSFMRAIRSCDLLVIAGCGGFADSCRTWNLYALGLIELAFAHHKRVALFGQGLGPLTDAEILDRMSEVLPRVSLLSSRGTRGAEAISKQIGVPAEVFVTTGDEAIEPAFLSRSSVPGNAIGINLRIASYSGVSESQADAIGVVLRDFAARQHTPLIPLPIAIHRSANDRESIGRLLGVTHCAQVVPQLASPEAVYAELAKCRIVVTGAYHAAVFALAQGIPTICLSASKYYSAKFEGLANLFGKGCTVVDLQEEDSIVALSISIEEYWNLSEQMGDTLRRAAISQIATSRNAYLRVRSLFPGMPSNGGGSGCFVNP
jgi:polysaccharide pyruvyl transferase WcaK-like protein